MNSENSTLIRERLAAARAVLEEALPLLEAPLLREAVADFLVTGRAVAYGVCRGPMDLLANSILYRLEHESSKDLDFYIDGVRFSLRPHTHISSRPAS